MMGEQTMPDLAAIAARAAAATPLAEYGMFDLHQSYDLLNGAGENVCEVERHQDAEFLLHARQNVLDLVGLVERLMAALAPPATHPDLPLDDRPLTDDEFALVLLRIRHMVSTMRGNNASWGYDPWHARRDIPRLVRTITALRARVATLETEQERWADRAVLEAQRNLANGEARQRAERERDALKAERERLIDALDEAIPGARSEVAPVGDLVAAVPIIRQWAWDDAAAELRSDPATGLPLDEKGMAGDSLQTDIKVMEEERDLALEALQENYYAVLAVIEQVASIDLDSPEDDEVTDACDALRALGEQAERLVDVARLAHTLLGAIDHGPDCGLWRDEVCDCGIQAVQQAIAALPAETRRQVIPPPASGAPSIPFVGGNDE